MNDDGRNLATIIVGKHVLNIAEDRSGAPLSVVVDMELDYDESWLYETSGWQPLGYGSHGSTVYWWSATDLVVLELDAPRPQPTVIRAEDTLRLVFALEDYWLLICETSIRLLSGANTVSSYELGEVLLAARWEKTHFVVRGDSESDIIVRVSDGQLIVGQH